MIIKIAQEMTMDVIVFDYIAQTVSLYSFNKINLGKIQNIDGSKSIKVDLNKIIESNYLLQLPWLTKIHSIESLLNILLTHPVNYIAFRLLEPYIRTLLQQVIQENIP